MVSKRLLSFDAFAKTAEDARVRTASGGLVTLLACGLIAWLSLWEYADYRRVEFAPEMVVDKARGERMNIYLNITFPHVPCEVLTMDAMDTSGEIQADIEQSVTKTLLDEHGRALSSSQLTDEAHDRDEAIRQRLQDPDYCGSCYGAKPDTECCNTCEEIKKAYAAKGWAFHDGSGMEQCEQEHYQENLEAHKNYGCNFAGTVSVNKVVGNLHFAPGASYTMNGQHTHDLTLFGRRDNPFTFSHTIHELAFGETVAGARGVNPLDGAVRETDQKATHFAYFVKVVATRYEYLNGEVYETNQYAVTSHERGLQGGRDEDHPHTFHSAGGVPGVFFAYDISPMKVINRERRARSFGAFLSSVLALVGGVVTVAAMVDRGVYEVDKALRRKKAV